ncbi:MAG: hypothetical protein Q8M40_11920 [Legionella sp.]|nr:hypothetical protein [Legionella sp.]
MLPKNFLVYGMLFAVCQSGLAGTMSQSHFDSAYHPYGVFTLGGDYMRPGRAQTVTLLPPFANYYTNYDDYASTASLGIGLGIESIKSNGYFWQLGISGYFNPEITSKGEVWQFTLPEYNNFLYSYETQYSRLVAAGKILGTIENTVHPYLSGEAGIALNRVSGYHETPLISEASPMSPYTNNMQSSFTWAVGAGIDVDLNVPVRLGIGYQFADLGKAVLGPSPAQVTRETLSINNSYSHQLRIQLTALI